MPKLSANDYRVLVDNGSGTFNQVLGQISCSIDRGETSFSTIDKAALVETTGRAMRNYALSLEYRPDLPDTTGHTRLETVYTSGASTSIQIRKAPFGAGDVVFACAMRVATMNAGKPLNDVVNVTAAFTPTAAPTTDTLA